LPPTPVDAVCDCVYNSLACVINVELFPNGTSKDKSADSLGDAVGYVCGQINCDKINGDGKTGKYGQYSCCNATVKDSWAFNTYYASQKKVASACNFKGLGKVVNPKLKDNSSCSDKKDPGPQSLDNKPNSKGDDGDSTTSPATALTFPHGTNFVALLLALLSAIILF